MEITVKSLIGLRDRGNGRTPLKGVRIEEMEENLPLRRLIFNTPGHPQGKL